MRHHRLEILGKPDVRQLECFACSPAFGQAGELMSNALQTVILNDGKNRVLVGVYNHPLPLEVIKIVARQAVDRLNPPETPRKPETTHESQQYEF